MAMTKIPANRDPMIDFYRQHIELWIDHAVELGLDSAAALTPLKDAVDAAVAAQSEADALRNAARLATDMLNARAALLRSLGGAVVATIRAHAEFTGNEEIYSTAQISPPAARTPAGPPAPPTNLIADPTPNGHIILKWKGTTERGQFFIIERSVDGGPWVRLEPVAAKKFTDTLVPRNTNVIQYQVWGARFDKKSDTAPQATVNFGTVDPQIAAAFRSAGPGTLAA